MFSFRLFKNNLGFKLIDEVPQRNYIRMEWFKPLVVVLVSLVHEAKS